MPAGAYGSFYCPKDCPDDARVVGLLATADRRKQEGRVERALKYAWKAHALSSTNQDTILFLVDTLLGSRQTKEATGVLRQSIDRDPGFHYAYVALARILKATHQDAEARRYAQRLLDRPNVSADLRAQAESLLA